MKNYDPTQFVLVAGGLRIQGYADGTFVKVSRNEQSYTMKVGADGEVTRVRNRNRTGTFVFTLLAESPSNDDLSSLWSTDENTAGGVTFECHVEDLNGTTVARGATSWVQKMPDITRSKEGDTREWTIECEKLVATVGGAAA